MVCVRPYLLTVIVRYGQRAFVGVRCPSTLAPLADSTCGAHEVSMRTDLLGEMTLTLTLALTLP